MQTAQKEWMSLNTWAKVRIGDSTSSPDMLHIRDSSPSQEWKIFFEKFAMASPWSWVGILRLAFGVWRLPQRGVEHETTNPRTNLQTIWCVPSRGLSNIALIHISFEKDSGSRKRATSNRTIVPFSARDSEARRKKKSSKKLPVFGIFCYGWKCRLILRWSFL